MPFLAAIRNASLAAPAVRRVRWQSRPGWTILNAQNLTWRATGTGNADGNGEDGWSLLPTA